MMNSEVKPFIIQILFGATLHAIDEERGLVLGVMPPKTIPAIK